METTRERQREALRLATEQGDTALRARIVREIQLANWGEVARYCGACGAELKPTVGISRVCTACGREYFPQLAPAIVVLVRHGDKALLVHNAFWQNDRHALVAGFVETGESAEECVRREVREETSLEITNIRYVGSESWPFPGQLMLGFIADYAGGEIRFNDNELDRGGFFPSDSLPPIPDSASLSGRIIRRWANGEFDPPELDILISTYGPEGIDRIASHDHPKVRGVRYIVSAQQLPDGYALPDRLREPDFYVVRSDSKGLSHNRNLSLALAQAPIAMIADDDLDFTPEYFRNILTAYKEHPEADAILFTYESAEHPKTYPHHPFNLAGKVPHGYFVTSFEITFRTGKVKDRFRFDEDFGIGAKFPCGEEDLFVNDLVKAGLRVIFIPRPIARHDGSTTGERDYLTPGFIRTKGATMRRLHPKTWHLRLATHAFRHARNSASRRAIPVWAYIRLWLEGNREQFHNPRG